LPSHKFKAVAADSLLLIRHVDLDFKALRLIRLKQLKRCTGLLTLNILGRQRPAPYDLRIEQSGSRVMKAALRSDTMSILRMPTIYLTRGNLAKLSPSNITYSERYVYGIQQQLLTGTLVSSGMLHSYHLSMLTVLRDGQ
jgi:hypothetical protein